MNENKKPLALLWSAILCIQFFSIVLLLHICILISPIVIEYAEYIQETFIPGVEVKISGYVPSEGLVVDSKGAVTYLGTDKNIVIPATFNNTTVHSIELDTRIPLRDIYETIKISEAVKRMSTLMHSLHRHMYQRNNSICQRQGTLQKLINRII